ncbi:MRG/MORF4L-binding protein isoform X3 [Monodelphis domestica]|uniref:MRG/MORF4L-binding protein isoform X3 n=1 Tax=Monodelphis domestica TaxID=13616 RepID=UPI0024E22929|nr:MRG/MORF4L-binding protein isoform X3 [Monodelphis domestica]
MGISYCVKLQHSKIYSRKGNMSGLEELAPQYTGTDTGAGTSTGTTGPGGDGESGQEPSDSAISRGQGQEGAAPSAQARGRARRRAAARGRRGRARSAQQLRRSLSRDRTMGEAEVATGGSGGGSGPGSGAGGGGGGGPGSGPGPGGSGEKGPVESAPGPPEEVVVWSPEVEVCLFHAMLGHKPVGVNRHFHMICIRDKFSQNIGRQISSKVIWDHLSTMYDMQALMNMDCNGTVYCNEPNRLTQSRWNPKIFREELHPS